MVQNNLYKHSWSDHSDVVVVNEDQEWEIEQLLQKQVYKQVCSYIIKYLVKWLKYRPKLNN